MQNLSENIRLLGKNIMIVSAHPDDDILGCGGLLSKLKLQKNINIRVIFLGEGTSCRYEENTNNKLINIQIDKRNSYARESLSYLGIKDIKFYNLRCGSLDTYPLIKLGQIIENEIESFNPSTIFTHSDNDLNNDHRIAFQSTMQATRPGALNYVKNIFSYEVLSSSEWKFNEAFLPNFFISLSLDQLKTKIKAFKFYKSEIKNYPHSRSLDSLKILARYRGIQAGCEFAEGYNLIRSLP